MDDQQTTTNEKRLATLGKTSPNKDVLTTLGKRVPDYTGDRACAKELAKRLESYYHQKGFSHVKTWVEGVEVGLSNTKIWCVRSNLLFSVPKS